MAETKVEGMKMAKASEKDRKALMDFFIELEEMAGDTFLEEIGRFSEEEIMGAVGAGWRRVVFGCDILIESCCDPELDYLEWKPEIKAKGAWAALWKRAAKRQRARLHTSAYLAAKYIVKNAKARRRVEELEAAADQAISDLQGVANLSVDSESHDEIVAIVQHVAAQFAEMKEGQ